MTTKNAPSNSTAEQAFPGRLQTRQRCPIPDNDPLFSRYHDLEWGQPVDSDRVFFEKVCLEGFQSGLSWKTVLHKRTALREAFDNFDMHALARYSDRDIHLLLQNPSLIRNRRKILSAVNNARRAIELQSEYGSLAAFFWQFEPQADSRPKHLTREWLKANPASKESRQLARELKSRGWTFVGPVNMYALMQALGIVNDHVESCHCRQPIEQLRKQFTRPQNR